MKIDSAPPSAISLADDAQAASDVLDCQPPPGTASEATKALPAPFSPRARVIVLAITGLLGFLFLLRIASILHPFLWAIVMAYILNPLAKIICRRTRMPRAAAVTCISLVLVGALAAVFSMAIPRVNGQITQLASDLPAMTADLQAKYFGSTGKPLVVAGFSVDVPQVTRQVANSLNSALNDFVGGTISAVVTSVERAIQFLLFLIVTFYLLLDSPHIGESFKRLIPSQHRGEVLDMAHRVNAVLSQYMRAQLILIAIMSVASFTVLSVMGVRFAIVLAPIVGVLEIFPIIGPFAAITLVTIIALFSPPQFGLTQTSSAIFVLVALFILRQIEDYAVVPNVVGHAVRLHPALILFAVATGTSLGGALGLFVAVPVTGALKVLATYLYQKLVPS